MNDINQVTLSGRLTADPRIGMGKVKYAFYSIAINKQFKNSDKKSTTYVNIAAFGREADYAEAYLRKGKKVHIVGELNVDKKGKLMVIANEQALKDNVLYQRHQNINNSTENVQSDLEEYRPFTEVADDGAFTPVYPDDADIPF